jgi:hypothetical protein
MKAMIQVLVLSLALVSIGTTANAKGGGCHKIEKACKKAGHKKHADCLDKILAGTPVDGVTADQADIEACKAKKAK